MDNEKLLFSEIFIGMDNSVKEKLFKTLLGRHFMNNVKVVKEYGDIPKDLARNVFGDDADRFFKRYAEIGRMIVVRHKDNKYLIWISNEDGRIQIEDNKHNSPQPDKLEIVIGLTYIGLTLKDLVDFIFDKEKEKRDKVEEGKKVVRLSESELVSLINKIISNKL